MFKAAIAGTWLWLVIMASLLFLSGDYAPYTGNNRLLHLRGQDALEPVLLRAYNISRINDPVGWASICRRVQGLEPEDALKEMAKARDPIERIEDGGGRQPHIMDGATVRYGQVGVHADKVRMAEILQEECARTNSVE